MKKAISIPGYLLPQKWQIHFITTHQHTKYLRLIGCRHQKNTRGHLRIGISYIILFLPFWYVLLLVIKRYKNIRVCHLFTLEKDELVKSYIASNERDIVRSALKIQRGLLLCRFWWGAGRYLVTRCKLRHTAWMHHTALVYDQRSLPQKSRPCLVIRR